MSHVGTQSAGGHNARRRARWRPGVRSAACGFGVDL